MTTAAVRITLSFGGTAEATSDFLCPAEIVVPAGLTSATVQLQAVNDVADEVNEDVLISIASVELVP